MKLFFHSIKLLLAFFIFNSFAIAQESPFDPEKTSELSSSIDDWTWAAQLRLQANLLWEQKPSSIQNRNSVDWGSLEFGNLWKNKSEPFEVGLKARVGPDRDTNSKEPLWQWRELRFSWTHKPRLSFGLLEDPVETFDRREWGLNSLSSDFESGASRWKIIPARDTGLQWAHPTSWGNWNLQITNGEGWPQTETGWRKDVQLTWDQAFLLADAQFLKAQFFVRQGGYNGIAQNDERKRRVGTQWAYQSENLSLGLVGIWFEDPVDGINGVLGEQVDLSTKGGQVIQGDLTEAYLQYRFAPLWRVMSRVSKLRMDRDDSGKDVDSLVAGVGRHIGKGMEASLLFQTVDLADQHNRSPQDRQRWFLAWVWGLAR